MLKEYTLKDTLKACFIGYITQAAVVNLAPVLFTVFQSKYSISFEMLGRLTLLNFAIQLLTDYLTVKFVDRIGQRRCAVSAHILCAVGLMLFGTLPALLPSPYMGLAISTVVYAVGGGLIEVLISPIADASADADSKTSTMSLLHSFYCWGQLLVFLLSTLLLLVTGYDNWFIIPFIWAVIPLFNMFYFMKVPMPPAVKEEDRIPVRKLFTIKLFVVAAILIMCAGASEQAIAQWASLFAEKGLGVTKVLGDLLGPCLFAAFMGVGRTIFGIYGDRIELSKALTICTSFCIVCYLMMIFSPSPVFALAGCAFCGLSVSLMWPGVISLTARNFPGGGTAMFGVLALFGDLGCSLGPWLNGFVTDIASGSPAIISKAAEMNTDAESLGLKCGILAAMVFPVMLLSALAVFIRIRKKQKNASITVQES